MNSELLNFEQLPGAVEVLLTKVDYLTKIILNNKLNGNNLDELMTVEETAKYLNISKQTIYQRVSDNRIPYLKDGGRLYFQKKDLLKRLKNNTNYLNS